MSRLSPFEFVLIREYFEPTGLEKMHLIRDIRYFYSVRYPRMDFSYIEEVLQALIDKNILSRSPDGLKLKFTDYGWDLYNSTIKEQKDWEGQRFIKTSLIMKDQILVRTGETFMADRILREIFSSINKELCVIDPYIGSMLFDLIEDCNPNICVRIITSKNFEKLALRTYKNFKSEYPTVAEMRIIDHSKIHDRFIIWDQAHAFHLGHSIKDFGKKDTQLNRIKNPIKQMTMFEERWAASKLVGS